MDIFAGIFAIFAFIIVCTIGAFRGMSVELILLRGLFAIVLFAGLGRLFGYVGKKIISENLMNEINQRELKPGQTAGEAEQGKIETKNT